jgi:hypothetical protein
MQAQNVRNFDALKDIFAQVAEDAARPEVTQQSIGGDQTQQTPDAGGQSPAASGPPAAPSGAEQSSAAPSGQPQQGGSQHGQALEIGHQPVSDQQFQNELTEFIYSKIVSWRWPERLAQPYKEEMVDEKIGADGNRDFTIIIPNTYGQGGGVVSNEDFQAFINEVSQRFGIHFGGAQRKGKKATLQFSTVEKSNVIDPMQDIYGGKAKMQRAASTNAYTLGEMLKARRDSLHEIMSKIATNMEKK